MTLAVRTNFDVRPRVLIVGNIHNEDHAIESINRTIKDEFKLSDRRDLVIASTYSNGAGYKVADANDWFFMYIEPNRSIQNRKARIEDLYNRCCHMLKLHENTYAIVFYNGQDERVRKMIDDILSNPRVSLVTYNTEHDLHEQRRKIDKPILKNRTGGLTHPTDS